jgi:hypothetical protein
VVYLRVARSTGLLSPSAAAENSSSGLSRLLSASFGQAFRAVDRQWPCYAHGLALDEFGGSDSDESLRSLRWWSEVIRLTFFAPDLVDLLSIFQISEKKNIFK